MAKQQETGSFDAMLYRQASEALDRRFPATRWLAPLRKHALERLAHSGFPTTRDEDWRYTNLKQVVLRSGEFLKRSTREKQSAARRVAKSELNRLLLPGLTDITLVFVDGVYQPELSSSPPPGSGMRIRTLATVDEQEREPLLETLGALAGIEGCQVTAFSTAFLTDGLVIDVEADAHVPAPVYAVFLSRTADISTHPRILMNLAANSSACLIEHHKSLHPCLSSSITEIRCADHARLKYFKLQQEHHSAFHLASQHISLADSAGMQAVHLDLGSALSRNGLNVKLNGDHAKARLHGLFLADASSHVDNHTRIDHQAPHTRSEETYRGVIADHGRGVFNGKIIVHRAAQKTNAQLTNANLLLSPGAEIDTKPELEIYADDVKCSHGSTVGRIDTNALFYLRTRGIPEQEARRFVIRAFGGEIVSRIPVPHLYRPVSDILAARLEHADSKPGPKQ